ncbi:MAG: BamA/TamA family outer membrane protein [Gammaproteobacteria bacterium]|nr:BamA/TamA family outer membrane protein [Gammaproteobacteria bacterium]
MVLTVVGGDSELQENIRSQLLLATLPCATPQWKVKRLFKRVEKDLQPPLRALGYYRPIVSKTLALATTACWRVELEVNPGVRTTIFRREITISGEAADDPLLASLITELPLAESRPLHHGRYEALKQRLRDFAVERGYFDFRLNLHQLRVDPDAAQAEIVIHGESGPRYRFGELQLPPLPLDERFVIRLSGLESGSFYSATGITTVDRNLSDSGYFQRVELQPLREKSVAGQVPIVADLEMMPRHAWRFGLGYATDTRLRSSIRYENRYLNRRGERLQAELRYSAVTSTLTTEYLFPGSDPLRRQFSLETTLNHEENDSAESDNLSLTLVRRGKRGRWSTREFVELLRERSSVAGERIDSSLLMPGLALAYRRVDSPLLTRRGLLLSLEARGAAEGAGSDTSFFQLRSQGKTIFHLTPKVRLSARIDGGLTLGERVETLPASLRFFAGGDNSVRGYPYKSLSPERSDGQQIGGRHLLTLGFDYEISLPKSAWWLALFIDSGNAFDNDQFRWYTGYGPGVRWYSPLGRLRLDLAFPHERDRDEWRLHFGLGIDL